MHFAVPNAAGSTCWLVFLTFYLQLYGQIVFLSTGYFYHPGYHWVIVLAVGWSSPVSPAQICPSGAPMLSYARSLWIYLFSTLYSGLICLWDDRVGWLIFAISFIVVADVIHVFWSISFYSSIFLLPLYLSSCSISDLSSFSKLFAIEFWSASWLTVLLALSH